MFCVHCVIHSKRTTTPPPSTGPGAGWAATAGPAAGTGGRGLGLLVVRFLLTSVSVVIAEGKRPVSFRTRKLSPPAPMVLHPGGGGRVGPRRTQRDSRGPPRTGVGPRLLFHV